METMRKRDVTADHKLPRVNAWMEGFGFSNQYH